MTNSNYHENSEGVKTSHRWEFSTPHPELIPHVDGQSFKKLIIPTDFLADNDFRHTVTGISSDTNKATEGWQRLKVWSYADLQYPGSTVVHTGDSDGSYTTMTWNAGSKATEIDESNLTYYLYGGVSLFANNNDLLHTSSSESGIVNPPEIYCYVNIPYGYQVKKSYIYIGDMRKSPSPDLGNDQAHLKFVGIKMKTKVLTVGNYNENPINYPGTTEDQEYGTELHTNKVITYDYNSNLGNTSTEFNKTLVIGLRYQPGSGTGEEALFETNFAVIKGGWIEFEKI
jgi:hypothetical protein